MVLIRTGALFAILAFFTACKISKNVEEDKRKYETESKAIRFMGTVYKYPVEIDERIFWNFTDEHVVYQLPETDHLLSEILALPETNRKSFEFLTYAFLFRSKSSIDTIYTDQKLKTWKLVKRGKTTFFLDESESIRESLQHRYSFFRECW